MNEIDPQEIWGSRIDLTLKNVFKFNSFRPLQKEVVLSVLSSMKNNKNEKKPKNSHKQHLF